jgi:hypothetical protein
MRTEVSSSVPHFLHMGSLHSPTMCKCLLNVLCPVSRPVTTLVCVLLKDSSRAPYSQIWAPRSILEPVPVYCRGRATLLDVCSLSSVSSSYIPPQNPQDRLRPNKPLSRTTPCKLVGDFISSYSSMPRNPEQPHSMPGRDIIQRLLALSCQRSQIIANTVLQT